MLTLFYKNKIKNAFSGLYSRPCREVLLANLHKLPTNIKVDWVRDGKYIIGTIEADGHKYKTQALTADEFVEMVNDTLYAVYEIPNNCMKTLNKVKRFVPGEDEYRELNNGAIKHAKMKLAREEELVSV